MLDLDLPLARQDMAEVAKVYAYVHLAFQLLMQFNKLFLWQVREEFPFISKYQAAWPVHELMLQFMGNHRNREQGKVRANTEQAPQDVGPGTAGPSTATTTTDPNNNGNGHGSQDGGLSDVTISDIDDEE